MKRKQSLTKTKLSQLIQDTQKNLVAKPMSLDSTKQNVSSKRKDLKTNNKEKNQKDTLYPVNTAINQYVNAIIQKKKRKDKEMDNNKGTSVIPLNSNWNTLSLGTEMYDSLFSFIVNTPQVWYDPLVWNIIYAALPSNYTMPDPQFVNLLRSIAARELMKPVNSDDFSPKDE